MKDHKKVAEAIILILDEYGRKINSVEYGLPIDPDTKDFNDKRPKEMIELLLPILTSEYGEGDVKLCPKCNGQGIVSKPPWIAGDVRQWSTTASSFTCDVCNGAKVLYSTHLPEDKGRGDVELLVENQDGEQFYLKTHFDDIIKLIEDEQILEMLEPECTSGSCFTESQNHCDCGGIYEECIIKKATLINSPPQKQEAPLSAEDDKGLEERARDFYIKQYKLHQGINPFPWVGQDSEAVAMLLDFAQSLNQRP